MKNILRILVVLACASSCKQNDTAHTPPAPSDPIVKWDMEDTPKKKAREAWIDLMHTGGEPDLDWRTIERENTQNNIATKAAIKKSNSSNSRNGELVADGWLRGTWKEKGSINQAGSIMVTKYDVVDNTVYCVSAGGTLWKGGLDGLSWEVVNQDYQFSDHYLDVFRDENGGVRLVAAIDGEPIYSDDGGATWQETDFPATSSWWSLRDYVRLSDGTQYFLHRSGWNQNLRLYRSTDFGTSWTREHIFTDADDRNYALTNPTGTEDIYVIEQRSGSSSRLYRWDQDSEDLVVQQQTTPVGFGDNDRAIIRGNVVNETLQLFTVDSENLLKVSTDTAKTWEVLSELPTKMWSVGFEILPSDPDRILYGEVNSYRSKNGGGVWQKNSDWWEYYDDIFGSLHADIMDIEEYKDQEGNPFVLVSNHGGISITRDGGDSFQNIGLIGLNVGQYYDVVTHPTDREFVYAGSQDQGIQRGRFTTEGPEVFDQIISGDYGHTVFSGPDHNMWTMYPGGSVSYYSDSKFGGPIAWYEINSDNETVWIPPLLAHPDPALNKVYMAGGNANGGQGSYLIELSYTNGNIVANQLPYNFYNSAEGTITAIEVSPFDHQKIIVTATAGRIFMSTDGGMTFDLIQTNIPGGHYLYGADIFHSRVDPQTIYICGNGYSNTGVLVSYDGGLSYSPMDEGLPPTLTFELAANEDESLLFAATEAGPYVYIKSQSQWLPLMGTGTPEQTYWSVEYIPESETARFGTYGRGIWDFEVEEVIISSTDNIAQDQLQLYPNPATDYIHIVGDEGFDRVILFDSQGKVVLSQSSLSGDNEINVSQLPTGIYTVRAEGKKGVKTTQFIKR